MNSLLLINIAYIGSWKHFVSVFVCVCVSLSLYLSFCNSSSQSLSSPDDELSENIWFVWSRTSYSGDKWRCHHADGRTDKQTNKRVKIVLLSLWTVWDWVSQFCSITSAFLFLWQVRSKILLCYKTHLNVSSFTRMTDFLGHRICIQSLEFNVGG